jgi:hypothetical protein
MEFSKIVFSWYSRGESIAFNSRIMAIIHSDDSTTRLRLIFILLNNSHHYTLIEECTILAKKFFPVISQKKPIVHKWVDGIKIICSFRFVVFLESFRFLYNFIHLGHSKVITWAIFFKTVCIIRKKCF